MYHIIVGLFIGIIFGFAFEKSRVFEAASIMGQLLFKRFIMLKVLMTAIVTSLIVMAVLHYGDAFVFKIKPFNISASIIGGSILGIGIALAGACPGTVFAQIGVGYKDAVFTFLGGIVAALFYGIYNYDLNLWFESGNLGKIALHDVMGLPQLALTVIIAVLFIAFLFGVERFRAWKDDVKDLA